MESNRSRGLLIINADDWGGWRTATDAALACHHKSRITSVSAMVFMADSARAAALAREHGLDVGLHINLNQSFTAPNCPVRVRQCQDRTRRFLRSARSALVFYNPWLRKEFHYAYQAQADEFVRLYGCEPSHFDGHQHMHLSSNLLVDRVIPRGRRVRRSFSFAPGEKSLVNRLYRRLVDYWLSRNYLVTDYFFGLPQCLKGGRLGRLVELSKTSRVEMMTHPEKEDEQRWLMGDEYLETFQGVRTGSYSELLAGSANNTPNL